MHMQDAANNNDRHTHQIGGAIAHLEAIFVTLSTGGVRDAAFTVHVWLSSSVAFLGRGARTSNAKTEHATRPLA